MQEYIAKKNCFYLKIMIFGVILSVGKQCKIKAVIMKFDKSKTYTAFFDTVKVYLDFTDIITTAVKYLCSEIPQVCGIFLFCDVPSMLCKKGFYINNICKSTVN